MWIVIPTCKQYSEMYDRLMMTITKKENIITILQMEDEESFEKTNQGYTVKLKRNLYEYGAWIGVKLLVDAGEISLDDFYLMMHDTCMFGSKTFEAINFIENRFLSKNIDLIFPLSGRFHNICIARRKGITHISSMFAEITHMTKEDALLYETKLLPDGVEAVECDQVPSHFTETIPYSDSKMRKLVHIAALDMIKFYTV